MWLQEPKERLTMHMDGGGRGAASEVPGRYSVVRFAAVIC